MYSNIIANKSMAFAIEIINAYKHISNNEPDLARQLLRAGTSIGANVKEDTKAISKADFNNKMSIALKEANETEYWIELMTKTSIIQNPEAAKLDEHCTEICKILNAIVKTNTKNLKLQNSKEF